MTKSAVVSKRLAREKRREGRLPATRPVRLDRGIGVTRNISASGVFFETNVEYAEGSEIGFAIALDGLQGEKLMLESCGEVVRVERRAGKVGIAARIVSSKLEPSDLSDTQRWVGSDASDSNLRSCLDSEDMRSRLLPPNPAARADKVIE